MRLQTRLNMEMPNDNTTSLDWSAIGRLVRRRTLESVSTYFQSLAAVPSNEPEALWDRLSSRSFWTGQDGLTD